MEIKIKEIKPLLRIGNVAEYIGVSKSSIDRMQAEQRFVPADFLIGKGKIRIWRLETIQKWLDSQRNPKCMV